MQLPRILERSGSRFVTSTSTVWKKEDFHWLPISNDVANLHEVDYWITFCDQNLNCHIEQQTASCLRVDEKGQRKI